jgi:hypothetical protein
MTLIIVQKRIRNLERHVTGVKNGSEIVCAARDVSHAKLVKIGFSEDLKSGESVLPKVIGPVARFNAEGRWLVHRDREMETAYRQVEWQWTERHGDQEVEQSDFRYVPYKRYPRTFVDPPSVELSLADGMGNKQVVIAPKIKFTDDNREVLLHIINVFLEIFGFCEILTEDLGEIHLPKITRLNWHVLPPGKRDWTILKKELKPFLENATKGVRAVVGHRLEVIASFTPKFAAVGKAGFSGYVILGFPEKKTFVCESTVRGNATYVFNENWEALSKLTKGQILQEELQEARLTHVEGWHKNITNLLNKLLK